MVESWQLDSARGPAVGEIARTIDEARLGSVSAHTAAPVVVRYGAGGVVAAVAIASVVAVEDFSVVAYATDHSLGYGRERRLGTEMLGFAQQLQRSFGVIPDRWKALAIQPRVATRWWDTHDGVMSPGWLTGEEKWLSAAAIADALGDGRLSRLYRGFLVRQGWEATDLDAAMFGRSTKLRKGFGSALRGVKDLTLAGLDRKRVELAGADLRPEAVEELVDVARLVRALVVIGAIA